MNTITTTTTDSARRDAARVAARKQLVSSIRFDWTVVALSGWLLGGIYLDGWAHHHLAEELETFFTPWHAVLYTGFLALAGVLVAALLRNRGRGYPWRQAAPAGYELALLGVLLFMAGGAGDMIWHILFGIEADLDALLSPTHLVLFVGAGLTLSGPLRAAWRRADTLAARSWTAQLPRLLSLAFTLSLLTFATQYAHPFVDVWAAASKRMNEAAPAELFSQIIGVTAILLQAGVLMSVVLLSIQRWTLPPGSLTLVFTLNVIAMSFLHDEYRLIPAVALAGLAADLLLWRLRPSAERVGALRLFAFAVPAVLYSLYFLALLLTGGIAWSIHPWMGTVVLAGITGWLLSYLLAPPRGPAERSEEAIG